MNECQAGPGKSCDCSQGRECPERKVDRGALTGVLLTLVLPLVCVAAVALWRAFA